MPETRSNCASDAKPIKKGHVPLNDTKIRNAKPQEKTYKLFDQGGLYLEINPSGSKIWKLKYRFEGRETKKSFGAYPSVSLAEARQKSLELKKRIKDGVNPAEEKKAAQAMAQEEKEKSQTTFALIARQWFDKKTVNYETRYRKQLKSRIENIVIPAIGNFPISELKRGDIIPCLQNIEASGHVETAHRVGIIVGQICNYAVDLGLCETNVAQNLGRVLSKSEHTPRAAILDPQKIGVLLRDINNYQGYVSVRFALKIMPYVFVRSNELRGAKWDEFNFSDNIWIIPACRMKRRREHLVPLATQTKELFLELKEYTGFSELVFPSSQSKTRPISDMGLLNALRRSGYAKGEMDIHGFRSIASTYLNEQGFRREVIEIQLSHAEKDTVRAAYNRAEYLHERINMMQSWANFLDSLRDSV